MIFIFPFSWECHHPNWRTHMFQRGRYTTDQIYIYIYMYYIHMPMVVSIRTWSSMTWMIWGTPKFTWIDGDEPMVNIQKAIENAHL